MKLVGRGSGRVLGGVLICCSLALPALAPSVTQAAGGRHKDPCQAILVQLQNMSPADFPPPNPVQEYMNAVRALRAEYMACEAQHGR